MLHKEPFRNHSRGRLSAPMVSSFIALCIMLLLTGPAWAMEAITLDHAPAGFPPAETSALTSSRSVADDSCRTFLNAIRHAPPESAMDTEHRPSAGKAAAVGLVLGLRLALGPNEVAGSNRSSLNFNLLQRNRTGGAQALAIADYRRCKNEQALRSLRELRWNR